MATADKGTEKLRILLIESTNDFLLTKAVQGCMLREFYIHGEEKYADDSLANGTQEALLTMELTRFIEQKIRDGLSIYAAVNAAREEGFAQKIKGLGDK